MNKQIEKIMADLDETVKNEPYRISCLHLKVELFFILHRLPDAVLVIEDLSVRMNNRVRAYHSTSKYLQYRNLFAESLYVVELLLKEMPNEPLLLEQQAEINSLLDGKTS